MIAVAILARRAHFAGGFPLLTLKRANRESGKL